MLTVKKIIEKYLKEHGYDGLFNAGGGECACEIADIAPCDEISPYCTAGIKGPCDPENCPADGDCEWHMVPGEPKIPTSSCIARDAAKKIMRAMFKPGSIWNEESLVPFIQSAIDADRREQAQLMSTSQKEPRDEKK